jgi:RNA polymerase sigma-70 factor (ECF subfamily)
MGTRVELALPLAMGMTDGAGIDAEEAALVAASRNGDEAAFARLIARHQTRVFRLAGRFFRLREDVEDVSQDTFVTAWRRLPTYAARAPFEHWITRICLRLCYARLSAARRREASAGTPDTVVPPRDVASSIDLVRLLARLAPADRFVLLLLDGEGWTVKEIADRIGWSTANVKVRAFRARRRLRRALMETP